MEGKKFCIPKKNCITKIWPFLKQRKKFEAPNNSFFWKRTAQEFWADVELFSAIFGLFPAFRIFRETKNFVSLKFFLKPTIICVYEKYLAQVIWAIFKLFNGIFDLLPPTFHFQKIENIAGISRYFLALKIHS